MARFAIRSIAFPILALAVFPLRAQWVQILTPDPPRTPKVFALVAAFGGNVFAGFESGVFRSSDRGAHWAQMNAGLGTYPAAFCMAALGTSLYVGLANGGVFRSDDSGATWAPAGLSGEYVSTLAAAEGRLYAGTCCGGLRISADNGATWRNAGIDSGYVGAVHAAGGTVYAGTPNGYFRSANHGEAWERLHIGPGAADSASGAFCAAGGALFAGTRGGLYKSVDGGGNWSRTGFPGNGVTALVETGTGLLAGSGNGIFLSADAGASWLRADSGLERPMISCLAISGGEAFAGVLGQGVWRRPLAELGGSTALKGPIRNAKGGPGGARAFVEDGADGMAHGVDFAPGGHEAISGRRDARGRKHGPLH